MNLKQAKAALALGLKVTLLDWQAVKSGAYIYMLNGETLMYVNPMMTHESVDMDGILLQNRIWRIHNELQSSEDNAIDNG